MLVAEKLCLFHHTASKKVLDAPFRKDDVVHQFFIGDYVNVDFLPPFWTKPPFLFPLPPFLLSVPEKLQCWGSLLCFVVSRCSAAYALIKLWQLINQLLLILVLNRIVSLNSFNFILWFGNFKISKKKSENQKLKKKNAPPLKKVLPNSPKTIFHTYSPGKVRFNFAGTPRRRSEAVTFFRFFQLTRNMPYVCFFGPPS